MDVHTRGRILQASWSVLWRRSGQSDREQPHRTTNSGSKFIRQHSNHQISCHHCEPCDNPAGSECLNESNETSFVDEYQTQWPFLGLYHELVFAILVTHNVAIFIVFGFLFC